MKDFLDLKAYLHKIRSSFKKTLMFEYRWIKFLLKNFIEFKKIRSKKKNNFCVNDRIGEPSKRRRRHQIS